MPLLLRGTLCSKPHVCARETVFLMQGAGGVSLFALQLARTAGATAIDLLNLPT